MNEKEALRALEERKTELVSRIPMNAPSLRVRYLRNVVEDETGAARKHLQALYASGFEVGPDFAAVQLPAADPKYAFWIEGIHRHLARCQAIIADQPAGE
jgi:hypothetical protein